MATESTPPMATATSPLVLDTLSATFELGGYRQARHNRSLSCMRANGEMPDELPRLRGLVREGKTRVTGDAAPASRADWNQMLW
jgi:hypothetical protein